MFGCFCEGAMQRSNLPEASIVPLKVRLIAPSQKYLCLSKRAAIVYKQGEKIKQNVKYSLSISNNKDTRNSYDRLENS